MTRTTIPNLNFFFKIKIIVGVHFQDNVRFSIFRTYPILNLKHLNKAHFHNLQNKSLKTKIILLKLN